ncbi:MAG: sulfite exporter TauE/SafE family protein [Crocinitomicaceae bacterium]
MELIEILGYFGALLVGLVLGLIGGGGSILTLPILAYLFHIEPTIATGYSLFVVGFTALVGTLRNAKSGMVAYKTGLLFSIPALITIFITRKFIVPSLPDVLFHIGSFPITKSAATMVLFAIVMLAASYSMIQSKKEVELDDSKKVKITSLLFNGIAVGLLAGFVGAGGGFLIIPALVFFAHLPMKKAVATSLMIIAINSLIGFLGDATTLSVDWTFLLTFTTLSVVGIFIGIYLNKFIPGAKLKKGFGWFVLIMGIYILLKETIL